MRSVRNTLNVYLKSLTRQHDLMMIIKNDKDNKNGF